MSYSDAPNFDILLVEDSEEDIYLTKRALKKSKVAVSLHVVNDGVEALEFLYQNGEYKDKPRPDLILLDLNLPKKDGREVLTEIKTNKNLKQIPVVILTTSEATEDIVKAYASHANSFIRKPVTFERFSKIIQSIEEFWLTVVKLPSGKKGQDT